MKKSRVISESIQLLHFLLELQRGGSGGGACVCVGGSGGQI